MLAFILAASEAMRDVDCHATRCGLTPSSPMQPKQLKRTVDQVLAHIALGVDVKNLRIKPSDLNWAAAVALQID